MNNKEILDDVAKEEAEEKALEAAERKSSLRHQMLFGGGVFSYFCCTLLIYTDPATGGLASYSPWHPWLAVALLAFAVLLDAVFVYKE